MTITRIDPPTINSAPGLIAQIAVPHDRDLVFVSGQVPFDQDARVVSDDFGEQARQALKNIADVLKEAGAKPENIVRMTWYVTDKREYLAAGRQVSQAFRELIGHYDIAMTAVEVKALIEDRAKVEIEVTAVLPD